jgi:DNA polymerase phi
MNQAADQRRSLHKAAVHALSAMEKTAEKNRSLAVPILAGLVHSSGTYSFDQRSKSKTAAKVLQCIPDEDATTTIKLLEQPVLRSTRYEVSFKRLWFSVDFH